jgi:hypothetical protein
MGESRSVWYSLHIVFYLFGTWRHSLCVVFHECGIQRLCFRFSENGISAETHYCTYWQTEWLIRVVWIAFSAQARNRMRQSIWRCFLLFYHALINSNGRIHFISTTGSNFQLATFSLRLIKLCVYFYRVKYVKLNLSLLHSMYAFAWSHVNSRKIYVYLSLNIVGITLSARMHLHLAMLSTVLSHNLLGRRHGIHWHRHQPSKVSGLQLFG